MMQEVTLCCKYSESTAPSEILVNRITHNARSPVGNKKIVKYAEVIIIIILKDNRPDIVIKDNKTRMCFLIDMGDLQIEGLKKYLSKNKDLGMEIFKKGTR